MWQRLTKILVAKKKRQKDKIKRRNSKSKLRFVRSVKQELFPCIKIKAIIA